MTAQRIDWPPQVSVEHQALIDRQPWSAGSRLRSWSIVPPTDGCGWRLLVDGREGERRLRELLLAFVGPGSARVGAEATAILVADGREAPVVVLPVEVFETDHFQQAIERLIAVAGDAPDVVGTSSRSLADLLRDFRLALANSTPRQAEALLRDLKRHPRLSGANRRHLDVEFHARLGRWTELRGRKYVTDALQSPAPAQVREWLLEAVWQADFVGDEATRGAQAIERFDEEPEALRWAIDRVLSPRAPGAVRLAILRAREQGSTDRAQVLAGSDPELRSFLVSLDADTGPPLDSPDARPATDVAADLRRSGRIPDLIEHLRSNSEDPGVIAESAWAVDEYEADEHYAEVVEHVDAIGLAALPKSPGFLRLIDRLRSAQAVECDGWAAWLDRLTEGSRWEEAPEVARASAELWAPDLKQSSEAVATVADRLSSAADGENRDQVEAILDLLIDLLAELPPSPGRQLLVFAVTAVLHETAPSPQVVGTLVQLVANALEQGVNEDDYITIVSCCLRPGLLERRAHLTGALDLFDVFVAHHRYPEPFGRLRGATQEALLSHQAHGNLDRDLLQLAAGLLAEAGLPGVLHVPSVADDVASHVGDIWDRLAGKRVFLYTMFAGLGQRFEEQLRKRCPTVDVVVDDSKASSTKLQQGVLGADYVIVDTRHAAHAATAGIDMVLPKSEQLFPEGKGVTSFLLRLRVALEDEAGGELAA